MALADNADVALLRKSFNAALAVAESTDVSDSGVLEIVLDAPFSTSVCLSCVRRDSNEDIKLHPRRRRRRSYSTPMGE